MISSVARNALSTKSAASAVARAVAGRAYTAPAATLEDFPGLPETSPSSSPAGPVEESKLANGVRVVSRELNGQAATVGVFVRAGSRYEQVPGTAHFLEHLAFKSTHTRSSLKVQRDIEGFGGVFAASAGREVLSYTGGALRDRAEDIVSTLADTITQPRLREWEVEDEKANLATRIGDIESDAQTAVIEELHSAAYGRGTPFGRSLFASTEALSSVNTAALRAHLGATFLAGNMVIAGANIPHADLLALCDEHFSAVPEGTTSSSAPAYVGGDSFLRASGGSSHLAVAFKAPSLNDKNSLALATLQVLMGAGPANSASFLAKRLAASSVSASAGSFAFSYSDTGLFGAAAGCASGDAAAVIGLIADAMKDAASASADDVNRAKALLKLRYLTATESASGTVDDLGRQLLASGKAGGAEAVAAAIDAVTPADVQAVAATAMASPLSLAGVGDASGFPRYDAVSKLFQ